MMHIFYITASIGWANYNTLNGDTTLARCAHTTVLHNNNIAYTFGGYKLSNGFFYSDVWALNVTNDKPTGSDNISYSM